MDRHMASTRGPARLTAVRPVAPSPLFPPIALRRRSGVHQTGVVVGCLRRLQNWSISACLHEYRMYTMTSTSFWYHLPRIPPLCTTLHTPCDMLSFGPRLTGCLLGPVIR